MSAGLLVVSDLDGCLLDAHDYSWEAARPALATLGAAGAALALASSKTRAEMQVLATELAQVAPLAALIVENGAALLELSAADPSGGTEAVAVVLGSRREELLAALPPLARAAGVSVRGFAAMTAQELQRLSGLSLDAAALALQREYGEPFVLEEGGAEAELALMAAAATRGLRITRGGRFWHLGGPHDKGQALRALVKREAAAGRPRHTLALGDAPNDLELLRAADRAVIVPRPDGRPDAALAAALPEAECAPLPGPRGWNAAVLAALAGERLARVRATRHVPEAAG